jgi:hypothetical protein
VLELAIIFLAPLAAKGLPLAAVLVDVLTWTVVVVSSCYRTMGRYRFDFGRFDLPFSSWRSPTRATDRVRFRLSYQLSSFAQPFPGASTPHIYMASSTGRYQRSQFESANGSAEVCDLAGGLALTARKTAIRPTDI